MKMTLNGLEREVMTCPPDRFFAGVYNTPATYAGSLNTFDVNAWFEDLKSLHLVHSGATHDIQYGFNDTEVLGAVLAGEKKREGKSNVWIGLDDTMNIVNLEILPEIFRKLPKGSCDQYAQKILERVVKFVETAENYRAGRK